MDERQAMEAFAAATYPRLVGALALYCGDVHVAEELAQEALLRACRRWSRVSRLQSPGGWAYHVGVNLASNHLRRLRTERRAQSRRATDADGAPQEDDDVVDRVVVREALLALTTKQREAIVLRYYLRMTSEEAAAAMGTSAGAVRRLTQRGVEAMRTVLDIDPQPEESRDAS